MTENMKPFFGNRCRKWGIWDKLIAGGWYHLLNQILNLRTKIRSYYRNYENLTYSDYYFNYLIPNCKSLNNWRQSDSIFYMAVGSLAQNIPDPYPKEIVTIWIWQINNKPRPGRQVNIYWFYSLGLITMMKIYDSFPLPQGIRLMAFLSARYLQQS